MKPLALVSTVVPPMRRGLQGRRPWPLVASGWLRPPRSRAAPAPLPPGWRRSFRPPGRSPGGSGPGMRPGPRRAARRAVRRGGSKRKRGQDCEGGHLHDAGDDAGGRADLGEPEQPDPDRQEVAAEGGEGEAGSRRGGQPARRGRAGQGWPAPPAPGRRRRSPAAGTASRSWGSSGSRSGTGQDGSLRWRSADPNPPHARMTLAQPRAGGSACSRAARPAALVVPGLIMLSRSVICQSSASLWCGPGQ